MRRFAIVASPFQSAFFRVLCLGTPISKPSPLPPFLSYTRSGCKLALGRVQLPSPQTIVICAPRVRSFDARDPLLAILPE